VTKTLRAAASLSGKWERSRQLMEQGPQADWDRVMDLECAVLRGPIHNLDDALAKLKAIELSFLEGERTDGADMAALQQTIRWLRTCRLQAA
jgi:hypothetical protein